ncbi:MAG: hypothetical protein ACREQ4_15820 [Candidatus Binataceae bacterium]
MCGIRTGMVLITVTALLGVFAASTKAEEPRPWLCRDKPVFTANTPVKYGVEGGRGWVLTLMQFQLGSGHDGFTVVSTRSLGGSVQGHVAAGSYYAVAMYRRGDRWICPGYAREADEPKPGVVADLCYGEHYGDCRVRLSVFPQKLGAAGISHH